MLCVRARWLANTKMTTPTPLRSALRRVHDIEDVARGTIDELNRQTSVLQQTTANNAELAQDQTEANRVLRDVDARERRNNFIMYGSVAFVLLGLIILAYILVFKHTV